MRETATEFVPVYESRDGMDVRLETAPRVDSHGTPYLHHRLVVAEGRTGAVVVATSNDRIVLVRSNRASLGDDLWELPRGLGHSPDRDAIATGERELLEETGFRPAESALIGAFVTDTGIFPQRVAAIHCVVDDHARASHIDGEAEEVCWFTNAEVMSMVERGVICDALSLAALFRWQLREGVGR